MEQRRGDRAGVDVPSTAERFERLEETLQICLQMWSGSDAPYRGTHYTLARTLDSPAPIHRPRILIGGGGERKTLRLVAKYADACNIFAGPDAGRKLEVLREHCQREGRDYNEIEKTAIINVDVAYGVQVDAVLQQLRALHDADFTVAYVITAGPDPSARLRYSVTRLFRR